MLTAIKEKATASDRQSGLRTTRFVFTAAAATMLVICLGLPLPISFRDHQASRPVVLHKPVTPSVNIHNPHQQTAKRPAEKTQPVKTAFADTAQDRSHTKINRHRLKLQQHRSVVSNAKDTSSQAASKDAVCISIVDADRYDAARETAERKLQSSVPSSHTAAAEKDPSVAVAQGTIPRRDLMMPADGTVRQGVRVLPDEIRGPFNAIPE